MTTRSTKKSPLQALSYTTSSRQRNTTHTSTATTEIKKQQALTHQLTVNPNASTWIRDESESEQSPAYRRQLLAEKKSREEKEQRKSSDRQGNSSLLEQVQSNIQNAINNPNLLHSKSPSAMSRSDNDKEQVVDK